MQVTGSRRYWNSLWKDLFPRATALTYGHHHSHLHHHYNNHYHRWHFQGPVTALTWGHNDKRIFIATGSQVSNSYLYHHHNPNCHHNRWDGWSPRLNHPLCGSIWSSWIPWKLLHGFFLGPRLIKISPSSSISPPSPPLSSLSSPSSRWPGSHRVGFQEDCLSPAALQVSSKLVFGEEEAFGEVTWENNIWRLSTASKTKAWTVLRQWI